MTACRFMRILDEKCQQEFEGNIRKFAEEYDFPRIQFDTLKYNISARRDATLASVEKFSRIFNSVPVIFYTQGKPKIPYLFEEVGGTYVNKVFLKRRLELGLTQNDVAERADCQLSKKEISAFENFRGGMRLKRLDAISNVLKLDYWYLVNYI